MDDLSFRQRLALRLEAFPLLRTLVLDRAFLAAFLAFVFAALGALAILPKVWTVTPPDFPRAKVRVSLLDLLQARALRRTAERAGTQGLHSEALHAWRGALANNTADPSLHAGVLHHLNTIPSARPEDTLLALYSSSWLIALTRTNAESLTLILQVLEKHRLPHFALELAASTPIPHPEPFTAARARCLLSAGRTEEFQSLRKSHAPAWALDPLQNLYLDAHTAGWSSGSTAIEAVLRLREASQLSGSLGVTAARLLLLAAVRRSQPADADTALDRLQQDQADAVSQHVLRWRLLTSVGQLDDARRLALAYQPNPRLPHDTADYAVALAELGLRDEAIRFLEGILLRPENHPAIWETHLALLFDARRWNDVRIAAAQVRTRTASFETARILGLFAEYRTEVADQRAHAADRVAQRLADARIIDNRVALRIAAELTRDGRPNPALQLLAAKRPDLRDHPPYWETTFQAALAARDIPTLRDAANQLLRIQPDSPVALSNRAALLLVLREEPSEALQITLRLVQQFPTSAAFQINHAFALLLNARLDDAETVLQSIDPLRLDRPAASAFHLARVEILAARGQAQAALDAAQPIQIGHLLPPQADRLAQLQSHLRSSLLP